MSGSTWEMIAGMPYEHWLLRDNKTGNVLAITAQLARGSIVWDYTVYVDYNGRQHRGIYLGPERPFDLVEEALEDVGASIRPVSRPGF